MKRICLFLCVFVLLLSGCSKSPERGITLTSFSAMDLDGNTQTEAIYAGHDLTMINLWATFCGPCIQEMPHLGEIAEEYKGKGFQIVGVVADAAKTEEAEKARQLVNTTGANYLHLLPDQSLSPILTASAYVPTTVFVDKNGKQVGELYIGAHSKAEWISIIEELLEQVR
jgi:thiol-disulfide isomerase/thioredoxin